MQGSRAYSGYCKNIVWHDRAMAVVIENGEKMKCLRIYPTEE